MNKIVNNGYIIGVSTANVGTVILQEEYDAIQSAVDSCPVGAPDGHGYWLKDGSLEWELVEIDAPEADEDISADEALDIILGGAEA